MSSEGSLFELAGPPAPEWVDDPRMVQPSQLEAWARWVAQSPELVLDYETDGLHTVKGHRPHMVGCYAPDKGAKVLDLRLVPQGKQALRDALRARTGTTIVHNAKNELAMSWALLTDIGGDLWDNQAASFAIDELRASHGQKGLCKQFGIPTPFADALESYMKTHFGTSERGHECNPNMLEVPYNAEDVECAWKLYQIQKRDAQRLGLLPVVAMDSELCRPVTEMEVTGIRIDMDRAKALLGELTRRRAVAYQTMCQTLGRPVDPASHQALFAVLYGYWGLPMHGDVEKQGKLDDDVLAWMVTLPTVAGTDKALFIEAVRDWRECDKLIGTYLMPWLYEHQIDGVLYPHLNLTVADTRRFTADSPNLQNIPARGVLGKMIRDLVISHAGRRSYSFDYSQIEYRVFAHGAGDARLIKGYRENPLFDMHKGVADLLNSIVLDLFITRDDAKHVNFGILYGMGIEKLMRKLRCTRERAKLILDAYMANIPSVKALKRKLEQEIRAKGYVTSVLGGRRHMKAEEAYKGLNTYCQMTAADVLRKALVALNRARPMSNVHYLSPGASSYRFQLQVHDELLFDLHTELPNSEEHLWLVKTTMEAMPEFRVPMTVEGERFAPSWAKKEAA